MTAPPSAPRPASPPPGPPGTATPAIAVRGLSKTYGGQTVVDRISFDVPAGGVVGFLGPNGAGKSTTMRMIIGLTAPSSGEAHILGRPFAKLADPVHTVGSIVDGVGHHPGRRAIEELRVNARAVGIPFDRCEEVLHLVGLEQAAHKKVGAFSLGMRQRLGIALAMLGDPQVLLLDEPANGLDPQGILWVRQFLRQLADEGRSVLVSSHLINEVARLADDVIVIRQGRIVTEASVAELTAVSGGAAVAVTSRDDRRLQEVLTAQGAEVVGGATGLTVRNLDAVQVGDAALAAGIALRELRPITAELEDVFMELTAGGEIA
ncbi:ABC transporter ATP-binding protein [Egicoccus sp. AB-alg2]|uniref:ABC transporter ATP-binding protein n=1 Tax=Egicoccus sp. AB-alg2 TaxID=3242693 RepID=UPI00359E5B86